MSRAEQLFSPLVSLSSDETTPARTPIKGGGKSAGSFDSVPQGDVAEALALVYSRRRMLF